MPRLKPQVATSLVERVTQEIKASILSGELKPGQQFSIAELCAELDVSHIPVREALRSLEAEHLVVLRPSRSAIVTPLSLDELGEVYRLRLVIEPDLAARSVPLYRPEDLEVAETYLEEMRSAERGSRGLVGAEAHAHFHRQLLRPAAGPVGSSVLQRLWDISERYLSLVYDVQPASPEEFYQDHLELLQIARAGDGQRLRAALTEHIRGSQERMTTSLSPILSGTGEPRPVALAD